MVDRVSEELGAILVDAEAITPRQQGKHRLATGIRRGGFVDVGVSIEGIHLQPLLHATGTAADVDRHGLRHFIGNSITTWHAAVIHGLGEILGAVLVNAESIVPRDQGKAR